MKAVLIVLAAMYGFAGACFLLSRWLAPETWAARVNEFVGRSVGAFATGLAFLLAYALLFPAQAQVNRNALAISALHARVDSLAQVVDSLRRP